MSLARYRAWRFIFPKGELHDQFAGLSVSVKGAVALIEDSAAVRQAILILLATRPGERVMRPEYGCDLFKLVFAPNDDTTAGLAIHYVQQALAHWEPRIENLKVNAHANLGHPNRMEIVLEYQLRINRQYDQINFTLNLVPGG